MDAAERSSVEIKVLLRKLDPKSGSKHNDRVRKLNKFRNYVTEQKGGSTPEFYDDDFSLLLLGSESPTALYDDDLTTANLYGLLKACGSPATDHKNALKRSARHAMALVKFLACEYVEMENGSPVALGVDASGRRELNGFAHALCMCNPAHLRAAKFEMHIDDSGDESRGGAREDACHVLVLVLTRHLAEDGETSAPLAVEEVLPDDESRKAFDAWVMQNADRGIQQQIKKASAAYAAKKSPAAVATADKGGDDGGGGDVLSAFKKKKKVPQTEEEVAAAEAAEHAESQLEGMGLDLYKKDDVGDYEDAVFGPPKRWADTRFAQIAADAVDGTVDARESEREREEAAAEKERHEEERKRALGQDPLGIRTTNFDLRLVQSSRVGLLQQAVEDIDEEMQDDLAVSGDRREVDQVVSLEAQRDALITILEGRHAVAAAAAHDSGTDEEGKVAGYPADEGSVLPTDPNFDALLFLTLVHRNASFQQLQESTARLSNKTESQVQRLQNLVRDNFALFVRCADGIDLFAEKSGSGGQSSRVGVKEKLNKLDDLAESCSDQARKSFKPLLDNTNEVRKVQSALAVLHRIGPLLQVPLLMKTHIENGQFSAAVKAYRRVLVIDDDCDIELLRHVKAKAAEAAREARRDLEATLADPNLPAPNLLDAVRDLGELIDLDVPPASREDESGEGNEGKESGRETPPSSVSGEANSGQGVFKVDGKSIHVRDHVPALACLLLQSAHFSALVDKSVRQAENSTERIFRGESVSILTDDGGDKRSDENDKPSRTSDETAKSVTPRGRDSRWKYDVLEARVIATIRTVAVAANWLPRLLKIGVAAREAEKRRAARLARRRAPYLSSPQDNLENVITAFEVFVTNISPAVTRLVEHVTFCALGCSNNNTGEELTMSFGHAAHDRLQALLRAPLPPTQSGKCASELAKLVDLVHDCTSSALSLRPSDDDVDAGKTGSSTLSPPSYSRVSLESPLEECTILAEDALVTVERRVCIYSFDVCGRSCAMRASGSGTFDGTALLKCVQKLSDDLTRPEECAKEVEKGCELVVRRICEGLASYVRDRGDAARLRVVSECADALNGKIVDVVREVAYLTNGQCEAVEEVLSEDITTLEETMFSDFLDNVRRSVASCAKLGLRDDSDEEGENEALPATFPGYLSASLLAIVRCRAQVERALHETMIRRSEGTTYRFLAMATAADGVVEAICNEMNDRMARLRGRQADLLSTHLQFLTNTLKNYLSDEMLALSDSCRRMLLSKAGRGGEIQGNAGPEGLAALEELERLGRVYVLCLGGE